jgi:hypothetical protein
VVLLGQNFGQGWRFFFGRRPGLQPQFAQQPAERPGPRQMFAPGMIAQPALGQG